MLPKVLDHEDGELTATQKVKRSAVDAAYHDLVQSMYPQGALMTEFLTAVSAALGYGSIYAMLALGFVIIYKSMQVISFAQPAFMLAGAVLVTYLVPTVGFVAAVVLGTVAIAAVALVVERVAIRPMVGKPVFVIAIITIGIDIVLRVVTGAFIGVNPRRSATRGGWTRSTVGGVAVQQRHLAMILATVVDRAGAAGVLPATAAGAWRCAPRRSTRRRRWRRASTSAAVFAVSWAMAGALAAVAGVFASAGNAVDQQTW